MASMRCAALAVAFVAARSARLGSRSHDPGMAIVNGTDAPSCQWKWQVGLYSSGGSRPFCGGSVIHKDWVVTAKHCVTSSNFDVVGGDVLPGRGQRRSAAQVYRRSNADLALVRVNRAFDLDDCFDVPSLPRLEVSAGQSCWITGWGMLYNNGPSATTLQQAQTRVISEAECRRGGARLESGDVCLLSGDSRSACRGDSGGPLVCQVDGRWTLFGATSRGTGAPSPPCSGINIYAGVHDAMDWIASYVPMEPSPTPSPQPTSTPTPVQPTPAPTPTPAPPTGACEHETDCSVSPWCRDSGLVAWCRSQGQFGACPAPYCRRV